MPSLYHFNSDQFKENLFLGGQQHMVAGRLCQYLKGWQLDGIRFLYKHFEKGESCILNDESGLGKVVTTSIFLGAILNNDTAKKCLIIVRDDQHIEGWRFHLSVLTQLSVKVIERTSDITEETVFLIKWSTIKDIGQISKTTFDHIIVDNRGDMLTNRFCTGILLRYYEGKISIVISSSDVTSDISLLHIILRLCGRLDRQYTNIKLFEEKFQLPALKEGVCNKIDLEDYFLKREKIINFCREFRLRRYCHQFEEQFPLVPCNDFDRYLQQWRNSLNTQSSGSAKLCSTSSEKDVEELFQVYFRVKQERDDRKKESNEAKLPESIDNDDKSNSSDELVVMSPLLFVSESESDSEQPEKRDESSTLLSDEIKEEEEKKSDEIPESLAGKETKSLQKNRRKLTKPVKKPPMSVNSETRLRSGKSISGPKKSVKYDAIENGTRKRGRPGKKIVQLDESGTKSAKEMNATEQAVETEKESKEKSDSKSTKSETKKRDTDTDAGSNINKNQKVELKDDEKKKKRKSLNPENDAKKGGQSPKEVSKNKPAVENTSVSVTNTKTEKNGAVNKLVVKVQRKSSENKQNPVNDRKVEENKDTMSEKKVTPKKASHDTDKKKADENKVVGGIRRTRSKLDAEDDDFEDGFKVKKRKLNEIDNKTKQHKEEVNPKPRDKPANSKVPKKAEEKPQREPSPKKSPRNVQLDLVIEEANKFLKVKSTSATAGIEDSGAKRRTRKSLLPEKITTSSGGGVSKPKNHDSSKKLKESNNTSPNRHQNRSITPKRGKPLTVYTLLGVHSRSTRGMQRYTRSSSISNKYMKVLEAQVGLDKLTKPKRPSRRQSVGAEKARNSIKDTEPVTVQESSAILESMQLGQALTQTNGSTEAIDFSTQIPKKVGYDFPLMLDKDIPDTECIITSQNSNKNEVIILTGSSAGDSNSGMEPTKSTEKPPTSSPMKPPPMVTIPRQSHNKAKSPDLFSTCSDMSLPCSQQKSNKSTFEGFKIFGSEVRPYLTSTHSDAPNPITQQQTDCLTPKNNNSLRKDFHNSPTNQPTEDEDAMFEITANGTFSNFIRVNSNGEMSPLRNKTQSTPPVSNQKNRITNYLISSNQQQQPLNGTSPSTSLDEQIDNLQKTPKRRKSLSGTMKRSPRGGIGPKPQSTKLTQWLIKNSPVVRISDKPLKAPSSKRKRLDLLFPDDK